MPVEHTTSYYAASANPTPERPHLDGDLDCDVCIVGAGFSGLSAALHLQDAGREVTMLEGAKVGWGASGRNGGQIVNGLNASLDTIERRYGHDTADFVGSLVTEGNAIIRHFISEHSIECDLKEKNVYVGFHARHLREFKEKQALWRKHGMDDHELLDRDALQQYVVSDVYAGGMVDHSGGHIHPLNLALGEAAAVEKRGGRIHEQTHVNRIAQDQTQPEVFTDTGRVRCNTLILTGNAYLGKAVPELEPRVMPVSTQVLATEPLGEERAHALLPTDACVEDVRYILDYYRLSADKRLLFGGGTVYGGVDPKDIVAKLRPNMEKVFPSLRGVGIDYAWSGNFALSFSRVPQLGKLSANCWHAMGYSGHGVTGSHLYGRLLAEGINGNDERFARFAALPWYPFPGGQRFRAPYSTVGSWWYLLRDRLGF
ncbi:MAG: gamma-glutamylputrescine oxidoreductase [Gammaproteobacteria bacterium]|nr:MAG: gamma-glutamylputrescine oxidoreductase [Gammaproteobacteria bacterium]